LPVALLQVTHRAVEKCSPVTGIPIFFAGVFRAAVAADCLSSSVRRLRKCGYFLHDNLCISSFMAILGVFFKNTETLFLDSLCSVCPTECIRSIPAAKYFLKFLFLVFTKNFRHIPVLAKMVQKKHILYEHVRTSMFSRHDWSLYMIQAAFHVVYSL
jgi:hypothetical protein